MHFTCCMFPSTGLLQCLYAMMSSIPRPNEAPLYRSPFYQFHSFSSFLWKFIFFIFLYIETYYYIVFRSIIRRRLIIRLKLRIILFDPTWCSRLSGWISLPYWTSKDWITMMLHKQHLHFRIDSWQLIHIAELCEIGKLVYLLLTLTFT